MLIFYIKYMIKTIKYLILSSDFDLETIFIIIFINIDKNEQWKSYQVRKDIVFIFFNKFFNNFDCMKKMLFGSHSTWKTLFTKKLEGLVFR